MAADASAGDAEYTIYYWPVVGRAAYAEVLFAYAGVKYNYNPDAKSVGRAYGVEGSKVFAVPVIQKGDFMVSQTNTIVRYVGDQLGLSPTGENETYLADSLMALNQDITGEMNKLKPETPDEDKDAFFGTRLGLYLSVFNNNLNENGVFFGDGSKFTTAELTFALTLATLNLAMGEERFNTNVVAKFPKLAALMKKVIETESIANFLKNETKSKFVKPLYEAAAASE